MLSGSIELREVFEFAPEWESLLKNWDGKDKSSTAEFLARVGAKAIYLKALKLEARQEAFVRLLRDHYYQPLLEKMLNSNQNLRRFLAQRYVGIDEQRGHSVSLSVEVSQKLEGMLQKQLATAADDGFKVLLPAYVQRSVHNAVIDFIRLEASWEKSTLQDVYLDPEQDDPRTNVADDLAVTPESQILSSEQVGQLNQLRQHLSQMLKEPGLAHDALAVVDCIFGLGLTEFSNPGQEMTMREVCDRMQIQADTMPRRIARCQVLLDKGLDLVRQRIYKQMPDIVDCWQRNVNLNTASRRELSQQIGMTEGEIERLIKGRQFHNIDELESAGVVKPHRIAELKAKGAVAAFVPVDINTATTRDMIDILGLSKEKAQKLVAERPFLELNEISRKGLLKESELSALLKSGAVLKNKAQDSRRIDLNRVAQEELEAAGIDSASCFLIMKTRPYLTWTELEEVIGSDCQAWNFLRQKFFLGISG